jgi:CBS domain-containing protein
LSLYHGRADATVSTLMTTPVITCDPDLTLTAAAELMIDREVHRLVVVEAGGTGAAPIGVISTADIVAEMAQEGSVWRRSAYERGQVAPG